MPLPKFEPNFFKAPLMIEEATMAAQVIAAAIDEGVFAEIYPGKEITYAHTFGMFYTMINGVIESLNDLPALIYYKGRIEWRKNNAIHRDNDLPAVIEANGTIVYYQEGYMHRDDDRPAMIEMNGSIRFYRKGKLHRDTDAPADINTITPYLEFYKNGLRHRDPDNKGKPRPSYVNGDGTKRYFDKGVLIQYYDPISKKMYKA